MKKNEPIQPVAEQKPARKREETIVAGVKMEKLMDESTEEAQKKKKVETASAYVALGAAAVVGGAILGTAFNDADAAEVVATPGEAVPETEVTDVIQEGITTEEVIDSNVTQEVPQPEPVKEEPATPAKEETAEPVKEETVEPAQEETTEPATEEPIVPEEKMEEQPTDDSTTGTDEAVEGEEVIIEEPVEVQVETDEEVIVEPGKPLEEEKIFQALEDVKDEPQEIQETDIAVDPVEEEQPTAPADEAIVTPGKPFDITATPGLNNIQTVELPPLHADISTLKIELQGLTNGMETEQALFAVREQTTFEDGDMQSAAVSITNNETGEDFMLVDADGDGVYESVYDADGEFVAKAGGSITESDITEMIASNQDILNADTWDVMHPHYEMAASTDELIYSDESDNTPEEVDIDDSALS